MGGTCCEPTCASSLAREHATLICPLWAPSPKSYPTFTSGHLSSGRACLHIHWPSTWWPFLWAFKSCLVTQIPFHFFLYLGWTRTFARPLSPPSLRVFLWGIVRKQPDLYRAMGKGHLPLATVIVVSCRCRWHHINNSTADLEPFECLYLSCIRNYRVSIP